MDKFDHQPLPKLVCKQVTLPDRRYYLTEDGTELQSVTTVLGKIPSKRVALADWRKRVGEAEASVVGAKATRRGSIIHDALEKYVYNDPTYLDHVFSYDRAAINKFIKILDENVTTVYGVEHMLYSKEMQLAGTADLICKFAGKNTIVDYKTSKHFKKESDITDYFLQATAYGLMVREQFDLEIKQICVLLYVDHSRVFPFVKNIAPLEQKTRKIFQKLITL